MEARLDMGLKDFVTKATTTAVAATGDQLSEWLNDYKKATKTLNTLGFDIGKFTIGMGVFPEVNTTLSGKIANIQKDRVEQLMQEHQNHSSTITLLKGLLLAKQVSDHLEGKLQSVTLHITLGIPPSVNVELN
jgi:hypothetical protein